MCRPTAKSLPIVVPPFAVACRRPAPDFGHHDACHRLGLLAADRGLWPVRASAIGTPNLSGLRRSRVSGATIHRPAPDFGHHVGCLWFWLPTANLDLRPAQTPRVRATSHIGMRGTAAAPLRICKSNSRVLIDKCQCENGENTSNAKIHKIINIVERTKKNRNELYFNKIIYTYISCFYILCLWIEINTKT